MGLTSFDLLRFGDIFKTGSFKSQERRGVDMDTEMFMEYLMKNSSFPRGANGRNMKIFVLLFAIQQAFDDGYESKVISVHPYFLRNLSELAYFILMTETDTCIWEEHNDLCEDTLGVFMDCLILLIQQGRVEVNWEQETCKVNKLVLPPTFVEWARTAEV